MSMIDIISKIEADIDKIKVNRYEEKNIHSESFFVSLKSGKYFLNNDRILIRETVVKNSGSGNAACVFAITKDKKIILVLLPRTALPIDGKVNLEIPAGYVESDEDSVKTAMRELAEETGYVASSIIKVDEYYPGLGISGERVDLYLAFDCEYQGLEHYDEDEVIICETVTIDEFKLLLDNGYFKGINARLGYYHYLDYIKKGEYEKSSEKKI